MLTFSQIISARAAIGATLAQTPVFESRALSDAVGARVLLKAECLQQTGSFKSRGALNRILSLTDDEKARGIIAASAGNHAVATAWAAQRSGVACTVVLPSTAAPSRIHAVESFDATVILQPTMAEVFEHVSELRSSLKLTLVHPFDDPIVVAGQGTVGVEIASQVPDATKVIVGVGGGGLIGGIGIAIHHLLPAAKVYGVEPEGAAAMIESRAAGMALCIPNVNTIADGLGSPYVSNFTFDLAQQYVTDVVAVNDGQIANAVRFLLAETRLVAEPAGAAATAALLSGKIRVSQNDVIVSVLSGGNIDLQRLKALL
ncbi:MAG: threonine/serine dehydratase [Chloroflexi bacterium]|nr:threonine/serine dehydratase [Chloroflexota bacterium]